MLTNGFPSNSNEPPLVETNPDRAERQRGARPSNIKRQGKNIIFSEKWPGYVQRRWIAVYIGESNATLSLIRRKSSVDCRACAEDLDLLCTEKEEAGGPLYVIIWFHISMHKYLFGPLMTFRAAGTVNKRWSQVERGIKDGFPAIT